MRRVFVESSGFRARVDSRGGDPILRRIQHLILENPERGDTIAGTGGIRKMRVEDASRGKGKRGGLRVLYLDLPDRGKTYFLALYDKNEKDDISSDEKKILRKQVELLKGICKIGL